VRRENRVFLLLEYSRERNYSVSQCIGKHCSDPCVWLNIEVLLWGVFVVFFSFFLNIGKGMPYRASTASALN
jgi:hypothetical protein